MNEQARRIQRTYLTLVLGNTLAASFIWGINTLFLLDAGLSNLEAFAANAFFTAGMVIFEVPTGVVADTWGRRVSYLLGTVTLATATFVYWILWVTSAPFWQWAVVSIALGLGFTFFSGAVEAWLVDALHFAEYDGGAGGRTGTRSDGWRGRHAGRLGSRGSDRPGDVARRPVPPAGRRAAGDVRRRLQAHAGSRLHARADGASAASHAQRLRRLARVRNEESACALDHAGRAVRLGRRHLHLLRPAAVPPGAVRRPQGLFRRRAGCRHRCRSSDRRGLRGAEDPRAVRKADECADRRVRLPALRRWRCSGSRMPSGSPSPCSCSGR